MIGDKASAGVPNVNSSQHSFLSNLPSMSDAGSALLHFAGPQMATWRSVDHTVGAIRSAFATPEGRELVRKGADSAKDSLGYAKAGIDLLSRVASQEHKYGKGIEGIALYGEHVKQIAQDAMRVKADYHMAEMAAAAGHKAAASMKVFLAEPLREMEAALQAETNTLFQYYRLAESGGAGVSGKLGKLALAGEKLLGTSDLGKKIIGAKSWWRHSCMERSLLAAGAVMEASRVWDSTKGVSKRGRATAAAMSSAIGAGFDKAMPELGVLDLGIKAVGKAAGAEEKQVEGFTFQKWAQGTANQYFQVGRAIFHQNAAPLSELHRANMAGENGRVLQGYAMIGERLAHSTTMDAVMDYAIDATNAASKGYTKSLQWWHSLSLH
jgi:hypothetical protein